MRRVMALWLPYFSTDLVQRRLNRSGRPAERREPTIILLTRSVGGRVLVERRCPVAAAAGIRAGLDLAQARSILPPRIALHTEPHRPDRDATNLHRLACWSLRISPTVALHGDNGLLCDLTGTARLYGREMRVARSAAKAIARLGFRVRIGIASTFACAIAVAKFAPERLTVVTAGQERDGLSALPVAALADDPKLLEGFAELGITKAGQVLALPRRQLASKFGLPLAHRIDQALGAAMETIEPVHPPPPIEAELLFDGPTDRFESVEAASRDTLEMMVRQLLARQRGVRQLRFEVLRPRGLPDQLVIQCSRPSMNAKHLWALLRSRLEHVDLSEPVDGLRAVAVRTARLCDRQAIHATLADAETGAVDSDAALGELADTLVNRLGADNVVRFVPRASRLPERSFAVYSVLEPLPFSQAVVRIGDRPTRLFSPPEPASVTALTPDGPVLELEWRGSRERVAVCIGPERIDSEWWRWRGILNAPVCGPRAAPPPARDYFAVQLASGSWLWVCRQAYTTRWFVHGEWA